MRTHLAAGPLLLIAGLAQAQTNAPEASAEATRYVETALDQIEQGSRVYAADWKALRSEALAEIAAAGARTTADTYPAIREALATLGDKHGLLLDPAAAKLFVTSRPAKPSSSPRSAATSATSRSLQVATTVLRCGKFTTSPWRSSSRMASRTEARLTPSPRAREASATAAPGLRRPSQMAASRASRTDCRSTTRGTGRRPPRSRVRGSGRGRDALDAMLGLSTTDNPTRPSIVSRSRPGRGYARRERRMASRVDMPRLGWAMEEGTLVEWRKRPGDRVEPGDVVCVIDSSAERLHMRPGRRRGKRQSDCEAKLR